MIDTFERLQNLKERIEARLNELADVTAKYEAEAEKMELEIAMASALAALKAASTDVRHERVRAQVKGARDMLAKVLAA